MLEQRVRDLRHAISAIDQELTAIDAHLDALTGPLGSAREELQRAFTALPRTAGFTMRRAPGNGSSERTRLHWRYGEAEEAWSTLAGAERRLRARRTELTAWRHEAVVEHRVLYQRLLPPRDVPEEEHGECGDAIIRRAG